MSLTETEILLVRGLRLMNIDEETIEGIVILLETEEDQWKMLDFLASNLNATDQDILGELLNIRKMT